MFINFILFIIIIFQTLIFILYYLFSITGFLGYLFFIVVIYEFFLLFWLTGFSKIYLNTVIIRSAITTSLYFYILTFFRDWFVLSQQFGIEVFIFFVILEIFIILIL